ncbi:hypothetical protein DPEC_G00150740 [Dallia pectoralis]|uniref:Uncharacterized protein n=1 Tax=Dallia pectoralis TaxID=75939 RepID=A0ACC2GJN2_DALPE|nr:hypothetical protein DPEC_G00150740 [Dallia pectoralis]
MSPNTFKIYIKKGQLGRDGLLSYVTVDGMALLWSVEQMTAKNPGELTAAGSVQVLACAGLVKLPRSLGWEVTETLAKVAPQQMTMRQTLVWESLGQLGLCIGSLSTGKVSQWREMQD